MKLKSVISGILVVIIIYGCAPKPPLIFIPKKQEQLTYFYRNGIPITAANLDSCLVMFQLDPSVKIGSQQYVRMWLLFKNTASTSYLLDALKSCKLICKEWDITPEPPYIINRRVDDEKAKAIISQMIGASLQAMAAEPTSATSSTGEILVINDRSEKIGSIYDRAKIDITNTAFLFETFKTSVNSGILRKNTVFPGESINGYVYFPIPEQDRMGKYIRCAIAC